MYVTTTNGEPGDGFQFMKDLFLQDIAACLSVCMYVHMLYSQREIQACVRFSYKYSASCNLHH